jgi:hypothetical protein
LWPELHGYGQQNTLQSAQVIIVTHASAIPSHVDIEALRLSAADRLGRATLRPGKESAVVETVNREIKYGGIVLEEVLSASTMVDVPIHNKQSIYSIFYPSSDCCNRNVVEDTEAPTFVILDVVARWANHSKSVVEFACKDLLITRGSHQQPLKHT